MANDCLFCRIVSGELGTELIHEDDDTIAFRDINPQAPVHCLVIPRRHIATLVDLAEEDAALVGRMYLGAQRLAARLGLDASGYRTVMNCGDDGGQTVFHLHLHLLGGRRMHWPPG